MLNKMQWIIIIIIIQRYINISKNTAKLYNYAAVNLA